MSRWIKCGLVVGMLFLAYITSRYWLDEIAIDPDLADMLPVIREMNQRFLAGHWKGVYDPVPDISAGLMPGYLPAMWLPYAAGVWMNFDIRWITVAAILLSFGSFLFFVRIKKRRHSAYVLLGIAALLFWWLFSKDDIHGVISLSEEGPVIFYYVLLCIAIVSGNIYYMAVTASFCLLSRYSMVGWIAPLMIFLIFRNASRKALLFSVTGLIMFLLLFLLPFGTGPVWQLFHLPASYVPFAGRVWTDTPEVFWLNLGLAKFFGPHHTWLLHRILVVGSFSVPVLFMLLCLWQKRRKLNNLLLATLKLSLLMFYQFIDVPFGYLFYTSVFVSLMIAAILLRSDEEPKDGYQSPDASIR
jgi:hypothetical protein